jgi:uncharacterized protein
MNGMLLIDANVLIYAARIDAVDHARYRAWIDQVFLSEQPFALTELTAAAFVRIITNPRAFPIPHTLKEALAVLEDVQSRPACGWLLRGPRHWAIFRDLCLASSAKENLINDAWLAALAIENDCEIISNDRDFAKFPGLRWRHPFHPPGRS